MKRILVVEDEVAIREFEVINLKRVGYETVEAGSGEEALAIYEEQGNFDIALLDISMPGMDGLALCKELRRRSPALGIIMLTARAQEMDKISGLMLGADDYITKPFSPKILVARVEAILRRTNNTENETIDVGGIVINKTAHQVFVDQNAIELSVKEFELLSYFVKNQSVALSRERILNNVWNYDYFGDARTIDTHVKKLRSKLGEKGDYIKTIWGMGYKFEPNQ